MVDDFGGFLCEGRFDIVSAAASHANNIQGKTLRLDYSAAFQIYGVEIVTLILSEAFNESNFIVLDIIIVDCLLSG